jgi:hypothetical protein
MAGSLLLDGWILGYLTMLFNCIGYTVLNGRMIINDELERTWKQMCPIFRYYPSIYLEKQKKSTKTSVRIVGL